ERHNFDTDLRAVVDSESHPPSETRTTVRNGSNPCAIPARVNRGECGSGKSASNAAFMIGSGERRASVGRVGNDFRVKVTRTGYLGNGPKPRAPVDEAGARWSHLRAIPSRVSSARLRWARRPSSATP